jgi:hypothetical protein
MIYARITLVRNLAFVDKRGAGKRSRRISWRQLVDLSFPPLPPRMLQH